mgnify:CR=1 FL=1
MTIVDIINKKRLGNILNKDELEEAFLGYFNGNITDYQMSSLLMAICIKGMTDQEILDLTDNEILNPDDEILSRCETLKNLGPTIDDLYSKYWKEFKAD